MNVVILGGTGFVGRNICECLDENGLDYAIASKSKGVDLRNLNETIDFLKQSRPDFIINCAANVGSLNYVTQYAADIIIDNSRMILSIYKAISETNTDAIIINPIANCAYPGKAEIYSEDQWWDGHLHRSVLSYGSTRRFLWSVGECFNMQYGIKSINFLVPNMYGPYDSTDPNKAHALNALISKFVKTVETKHNSIEIWGTGAAIREWLYAKDFGRIIVEVLKNPKMIGLTEPVNIAQNFGLSVRELVDIIGNFFDYNGGIYYDIKKPDGSPKKVMDDRRFRKVFPNFEFTTFLSGIKKTIDYYKSIYPY